MCCAYHVGRTPRPTPFRGCRPMSQFLLPGMPEPVLPPPGESDEFYTPWEVFIPLDKELSFTVDVAATAESTKVARHFYSVLQDGLEQPWAGERVWCNPPYSDITRWVEKADFEIRHGCELVAMLLPATKTEQPWWQQHIERWRDGRGDPGFSVETRFLPKRIAFGFPGNPNGGSGSGWFGNVLVLWRAASSRGR
jgi:phage N-6-adenine-methyltransferase